MIAMKLAALAAPGRVLSLTVLSVTGGGMEVIPRRYCSVCRAFFLSFAPRLRRSRQVAAGYPLSSLVSCSWRAFKLICCNACSSGAEARAYLDVKFHFSSDTLRRKVRTRHVMLDWG